MFFGKENEHFTTVGHGREMQKRHGAMEGPVREVEVLRWQSRIEVDFPVFLALFLIRSCLSAVKVLVSYVGNKPETGF